MLDAQNARKYRQLSRQLQTRNAACGQLSGLFMNCPLLPGTHYPFLRKIGACLVLFPQVRQLLAGIEETSPIDKKS